VQIEIINNMLHIWLLTHHCASDKIENEIGGACSSDGEGRGVYRVGIPEVKDYWRDPGVDGRMILTWIFRKWDVGYGLD
jgi:hypothetical protein